MVTPSEAAKSPVVDPALNLGQITSELTDKAKEKEYVVDLDPLDEYGTEISGRIRKLISQREGDLTGS